MFSFCNIHEFSNDNFDELRRIVDFLCLRGQNLPESLKPLFHLSQNPTRKLAASAFNFCDWMKVLPASLRVGFYEE